MRFSKKRLIATTKLLEGEEQVIGQKGFELSPDSLHRLHFRAVRRLADEPDACLLGRSVDCLRSMGTSTIKDDDKLPRSKGPRAPLVPGRPGLWLIYVTAQMKKLRIVGCQNLFREQGLVKLFVAIGMGVTILGRDIKLE